MLPFLLDSASDATKAIDACRSLDGPSLWWVNGVPNYLFNFRFCEQQGARVWSITTSRWHHQYNSCLAAQVAEHIPPQHEEQFLENLGWNASLRMNQLSLMIQKSKTSNRLSWSLVRRNQFSRGSAHIWDQWPWTMGVFNINMGWGLLLCFAQRQARIRGADLAASSDTLELWHVSMLARYSPMLGDQGCST